MPLNAGKKETEGSIAGTALKKKKHKKLFQSQKTEIRTYKIHIEGHIPSANEAVGYRFSKEENNHVFDDEVSLPVTAPDGGLITSLNDFVRWSDVYKNQGQKILSQESLTKMTGSAIKTGWGGPFGTLDFMGCGLFVNGPVISHMGEIVGFKS